MPEDVLVQSPHLLEPTTMGAEPGETTRPVSYAQHPPDSLQGRHAKQYIEC